jgi:hypothetical protein
MVKDHGLVARKSVFASTESGSGERSYKGGNGGRPYDLTDELASRLRRLTTDTDSKSTIHLMKRGVSRPSLRISRLAKKRVGISELVGTVLAIAITVIAGAGVWGYVRSQAGLSEQALGNSVLNNNNFLQEHFAVEDLYYGTSTSATLWVYNTGNVNLQVLSIRLVGPSGTMNLLFNYTQSGSTKTDYVFDLRSSLTGKCKTAASSYESPLISATVVKTTNAQLYTLTIPPTQSNCPSYGSTFTTGNTYSVIVTGVYGNVQTYSQGM